MKTLDIPQKWGYSGAMINEKSATTYPGIRSRKHQTRKLKNGQFDQYFFIRYRINGVLKEEGYGWASDGFSAASAFKILSALKKNVKEGTRPQSLAEMQVMAAEEKAEREAEAEKEKLCNMSLGSFFDEYYLPNAQKEKRSWKTDEQRFNKLIRPKFGNYPLLAIKKEMMQAWVDKLAATLSASTVKQYLGIIKHAYSIANKITLEDRPIFTGINPCTNIILPKIINARDRFFTVEEVDKIIAATKKCRYRDMHDCCVLSLNTGLRLGELRRLLWSDVDLTHKILTVRDIDKRKTGGKVPINKDALSIFKARQKLRTDDSPLIFPPVINNGGERANLSHLFREIIDELALNEGIPIEDRQRRAVFHTFRHTFASWLALSGTDIYRIKELMRHRDISMTMRYAHLCPNITQSAVANLHSKISNLYKESVA